MREGEESESDMHIHTYLVMQMHIAIFGVGLSFDRGGHSDVEVGGMHGEGGGTDGQVGERDGGLLR